LITSSALLSIGLVTILIVLNLVATGCVVLSTVYSSAKRILQLALVWLLPLVGAILALSVWAHDRKAYSRDPVRDDQEPWLPGIGPESDRGHHDGGFGDGAGHDGGGADGGSAGH